MDKYSGKMFIKYTIVNGLLTGAYFGLYYILIERVDMDYILSNFLSYTITVLLAYFTTKNYVFKSKNAGGKEFFIFSLVRVAMVGISSTGLWILIHWCRMGEYVSFIIINSICFGSSFVINKMIFMRPCIDEKENTRYS